MKKLKKRIKRFLALWLKDELIDIAGLGEIAPRVIPVHPNIKELRVDFVLSEHDRFKYEPSLGEAKRIAVKALFDEFTKYVKIDSDEIFNPTIRGIRILGSIYIVDKK